MEKTQDSPQIRLANQVWQVVYQLDGSRFSLLHDGRAWLAGGIASVATDQGLLRPEDCGPGEARMEAVDGPLGAGRRLIVVHRGRGSVQLTVQFTAYDARDGLSMGLTVHNMGSKPLRVFGFNVLEALGDKTGFWPGHGGTDGAMFKCGFHSASLAVVRRPGGTDTPAGGRDGWLRFADPGTRPFTEKDHFISDWACALRARSGGGRCAMAFITCARQLGHFFYRRSGQSEDFLARSEAEGMDLGQGASLSSETLYLAVGTDEGRLLGECFEAMGKTMKARLPSVTRVIGRVEPDFRFEEGELARRISCWKRLGKSLPLAGVLVELPLYLEGGEWERRCREAAHLIGRAGLTPGIRVAPLTAPEGGTVAREHPDWLIRNGRRPAGAGSFKGKRLYGLDATNPAVQEHVRKQIRFLAGELGYGIIALDGLYAAALPGERHDPEATRIAALRRGLEIIREEAPAAFLIGTSCPIGPAVGLLDAVEIGPSFEPSPGPAWLPFMKKPKTRADAAVVTANLALSDGRLWSNAVHASLSKATDAPEGLLPAAMSGTTLILDEMDEAAAGAGGLFPSWYPRPIAPPAVAGVMEETGPVTIARADLGHARTWVVVFNRSGGPATVSCSVRSLGLNPAGSYHVSDPEGSLPVATVRETFRLGPLPPGVARAYIFSPAGN